MGFKEQFMIAKNMQGLYNAILAQWGFKSSWWTTDKDRDQVLCEAMDRYLRIDGMMTDDKGCQHTFQGRNLSYANKRYMTVVISCQYFDHSYRVHQSEFFTCCAEYILCGYGYPEGEVIAAVLVDWRKFRERVLQEVGEDDFKEATHRWFKRNRETDRVFLRVDIREILDDWDDGIIVEQHFTKEAEEILNRQRIQYRAKIAVQQKKEPA